MCLDDESRDLLGERRRARRRATRSARSPSAPRATPRSWPRPAPDPRRAAPERRPVRPGGSPGPPFRGPPRSPSRTGRRRPACAARTRPRRQASGPRGRRRAPGDDGVLGPGGPLADAPRRGGRSGDSRVARRRPLPRRRSMPTRSGLNDSGSGDSGSNHSGWRPGSSSASRRPAELVSLTHARSFPGTASVSSPSKPKRRTSGRNVTPLCSATMRRTCSMRARTSSARPALSA